MSRLHKGSSANRRRRSPTRPSTPFRTPPIRSRPSKFYESAPTRLRNMAHALPDLPSLPRTVLHAARSIDALDQLRDGYHSDFSRPPRPPRARTRPARDSTSYFSDADIGSSSLPTRRPQERDHEASEKLTSREYHYRRRSQTISTFPATPVQPVLQDLASQETAVAPDDSHLSNQYVYDDRQSHGVVYGQRNQQDHPPHTASTVDSHTHQQMSSVHTVPTPPMTPDDGTLTSDSVSVHDRSRSLSPEAVLREPPSPPPPTKHATPDSDAGYAVPEVTVISNGMLGRNLSKILTSDFPSLLGKTEPDSPAPLPVPPPRPRLPRGESEPEPEWGSRRRSIINRKDSISRRFRRSSLYSRDRKVSDPSPPVTIKTRRLHVRDSTVRDSFVQGSSESRSTATYRDREAESSHSHDMPEVVRASGADGPSEGRKRAKMAHRKSLSHVSLGITPLPNLVFGPSPSPVDNVSMASTLVAYPDSDEYGGPSPQLLPPHPPMPVYAPQPQAPQPRQQPQTVAQALELTPLPKKDSPLPPIRKDTRLPTPPRDERSMRVSRSPPSPEPPRHHIRDGHRTPPDTVRSAYSCSLPPESLPPSPEADALLLRPMHFHPDEHDYEQSSPSPPLSSNPLLSRPTSAFSPIPPQVVVPLISPSPIPPQYPAPTITFPPAPPRSDPAPRRAPSPVAPPHRSSPAAPPRRPSPVAPPRRPSPAVVAQPRRVPSPVVQQRRASPVPAPRRIPSPLPPARHHTPTPPPAPRRVPSPLPPRRDEPPTPAPLPLSPPSRIDHDLPTPLPQPPLPPPPRVRPPVYLEELPRGFSAPRVPEPVRQHTPPVAQPTVFTSYATDSPRSYSPVPEPPRSRTPHESRHEQREQQRRSEDRQERAYHSSQIGTNLQAQTAQPPPSSVASPSSRAKPSSTPHPTSRQYASVRRTAQGQSLVAQSQHAHQPFRSETPPPAHHVSTRAQSPEHTSTTARMQSPVHLPPGRAQSPQEAAIASAAVRAQSPPAASRVQSPPIPTTTTVTRVPAPAPPPPPPPSSYTHVHTQTQTQAQMHARMQSQPSELSHDGENGTEEFGRTTVNSASESMVASPQHRVYATSTESTPLPLPNTPSTTFSHPYRSTNAGRHTRNGPARGGSAPPRSSGEARRQHRRKEEPAVVTFDEYAGLSREQIGRAAALTVIAQNGLRVQFGELFRDRRTIVIFIRHFWCPNCQDYMYSISRNVDVEALKRAGIDFILIGNGSHGMIKSYRHIFRTPIPMFTDPSLRLHAALGMTLRTNDPGPDSEKGDYCRHGPIGGLAMVVRNALRVGMPVWEKGGDASQLGGEFVLGPGLGCSFAHRMTTTRSHAPILDVLMGAGYHFSIPTAPDGAPTLSPQEEEAWMEERRRSLARMRARREKRREIGPMPSPGQHADEAHLYEPELGYSHGSDSDSGSISAQGSWTSNTEKREVAELVAQREREQERERERERKRMPGSVTKKVEAPVKERRGSRGLGLHVSNPDDQYNDYDRATREPHHRKHHGSARVQVAHQEDTPEWGSGTLSLAYINELGRREDGYETVDEEMPATYTYRRD
ncbi:hypothetical protein VTO73DRAFT_9201 [Trametes versicolor]